MKLRRLLQAKSNAYLYNVEYVNLTGRNSVEIETKLEHCNIIDMGMESGHRHEMFVTIGQWIPIKESEFHAKIASHRCNKTIIRRSIR